MHSVVTHGIFSMNPMANRFPPSKAAERKNLKFLPLKVINAYAISAICVNAHLALI
jgi:hypothetical protein